MNRPMPGPFGWGILGRARRWRKSLLHGGVVCMCPDQGGRGLLPQRLLRPKRVSIGEGRFRLTGYALVISARSQLLDFSR